MARFKTFVARRRPAWSALPASSVVLVPSNPTWNDFGKQVLATINIKDAQSRTLTLDGFVIALTGDPATPTRSSFFDWVVELQQQQDRPVPADFDEPAFLTLLSDDRTYRALAEWAGSRKQRHAILLAINDINLARVAHSIPRDLIDQVTADETFTLGVMRSSSAYRAFAKGARYVSREPQPWIEDARLDFVANVRLKGFDAHHAVEFTFEGTPSIVSDRVHVLIGKNGTGKSQLLNQLVGSLALNSDSSNSDVFPDKGNSLYAASAASWHAIPNSVLVFSTDDEHVFPREVRLDAPLDYWHFSLASRAIDEPSLDPNTLPLGRALLDLIRDDAELNEKRRFRIFRDIVDPVLPLSRIHLPLRSAPRKVSGVVEDESGQLWLSLADVPRGEQALLYLAAAVDTTRDIALMDSAQVFPPSSGQRVFLRFATLALCAISQGSLLILDEPETHLHPNFISEFMTLLHDLLTATSSIALIATHSPYVVREVPTACVHVVRRQGNAPSIGDVYLKTLGASVSSISDAVFGDASATKFHRILAQKMSKEGMEVSANEVERVAWLLATYGEDLNAEMLSTIRFLMSRPAPKNDPEDGDA